MQFSAICRKLRLVGTSPTSNVFRIALSDLMKLTEVELDLPAYVGHPITVIINIMYVDEYTGPYRDPNGTLDASKTPATNVTFPIHGFGISGLFNEPALVPFIIWNFPFATSIDMSHDGFRGSILAPEAGTSSLLLSRQCPMSFILFSCAYML